MTFIMPPLKNKSCEHKTHTTAISQAWIRVKVSNLAESTLPIDLDTDSEIDIYISKKMIVDFNW